MCSQLAYPAASPWKTARRTASAPRTRSIPNRPGSTRSLRTIVTWPNRLCPANTLRRMVPRISCFGAAFPLRYCGGQSSTRWCYRPLVLRNSKSTSAARTRSPPRPDPSGQIPCRRTSRPPCRRPPGLDRDGPLPPYPPGETAASFARRPCLDVTILWTTQVALKLPGSG